MRVSSLFFVPVALALLVACSAGPDFAEVQAADTIEAYEGFLAADPETFYKPQIDVRLEELYFEKAKKEASIASWDVYFGKFPEGKHAKEAKVAKEDLAFSAAAAENTLESWKKFVAEWPAGSPTHLTRANGGIFVAEYGKLSIGEPTVLQVNLAEDPKGPLNGWGVRAPITNGGDKTFTYVGVQLALLADDGSVLQTKDYALVSPTWGMPATEEQTRPMAPGDTRTWAWDMALDGAPADWHQKVKLVVTGAQ